ncbi:MAG: hypothetical protein GY799_06855 [Desulfobulbaceae bacterium]|nr:hypothetical protein [Desulfobulbaceae bacterium]
MVLRYNFGVTSAFLLKKICGRPFNETNWFVLLNKKEHNGIVTTEQGHRQVRERASDESQKPKDAI